VRACRQEDVKIAKLRPRQSSCRCWGRWGRPVSASCEDHVHSG
jgi:hypothetical protein